MSPATPTLTPTQIALALAALRLELRAIEAYREIVLTEIARLQGER